MIEHLLLWLVYAVKARCMPDEAYSSAIFDEDEDGRAASGVTAHVVLDPGCAGHDTPADRPGGGSMTSGCAGCGTPAANPGGGSIFAECGGCDNPADNPGGGSMTRTSVVVTGLGPRVGPTMGPSVGNPDELWLMTQVSSLST